MNDEPTTTNIRQFCDDHADAGSGMEAAGGRPEAPTYMGPQAGSTAPRVRVWGLVGCFLMPLLGGGAKGQQ